MSSHSISNWNHSATSSPSVTVTPRSVEELIQVVKDVEKYPTPVRAAGHLHSLNACFVTSGTQMFMDNFTDIQVDIEAKTVTVGAYVKMIEIRNALRKYGMQTEVMPEIGNASAGSVACCGTKDSSLGKSGLGQVSSTVIALRLVNAQGEVESVSLADDPERMRIIRCSYGLMGIVYEATFSIQELVMLQYRYASLKLDPPPSIDQIFSSADGVLGFAQPYYKRLIVERRTIIDKNTHPDALNNLRHRLRDQAWENYVAFFTGILPYNWWFPVFDRMLNWGLRALSTAGGFHAHRSDSMVDFKSDRRYYFDFSFFAIPVSQWRNLIPKYLDFCARYQRETGFRMSLPTEVYFIRRDSHSLMSFSAKEDIFTLDLVDSRANHPLWHRMNREFNQLAAAHGGRPLLNQTKELERSVMNQTLTEEWPVFLAAQKQSDPNGRFLSSFFQALM